MRRISPHPPSTPSLAPLTARLRCLPAALFIIAVPVFLITASVAWAFNSPGLYRGGFEKYDISLRSGITEEGLDRVAAELRGLLQLRERAAEHSSPRLRRRAGVVQRERSRPHARRETAGVGRVLAGCRLGRLPLGQHRVGVRHTTAGAT